jgi:hypothetical protein
LIPLSSAPTGARREAQFDGLDAFPTHVCHLQLGATTTPDPLRWPLARGVDLPDVDPAVRAKMDDPDRAGSRLLELALSWLVADRQAREAAPEGTYRPRGAHKGEETRDSEVFYRCGPVSLATRDEKVTPGARTESTTTDPRMGPRLALLYNVHSNDA